MIMDAKDILQKILDDKHIGVRKLATKTMIPESMFYNIKYGKSSSFSIKAVKAITKVYPEINENFLLGLSDEAYIDNIINSDNVDITNFSMSEFRAVNNLRQKDAAEYFGCQQSFLSNIENGKAKVPTSYIEKIKADGIYRLPEDNDKVEPAQSEPPKQDVLKYIAALEALLEYKDKEIEQLKDLLDQLQHSLKQ